VFHEKGVSFFTSEDGKAELDKVEQQLESALKLNPKNISGLLAQGCFHFRKGNFKEAKKSYTTAIREHPFSPAGASIRVGFGLCCYKLGQFAKAHAGAYVRAVSLFLCT
jgi:Tfp pilus assembly protein PilF